MSTVSLGLQPFDLVVTLPSDADFVCTLVSTEGWADGTSIELRFIAVGAAPIVWPATVSGTDATWDVHAADVAEVVSAAAKVVRLHYTDESGDDLLWGKGRVIVA